MVYGYWSHIKLAMSMEDKRGFVHAMQRVQQRVGLLDKDKDEVTWVLEAREPPGDAGMQRERPFVPDAPTGPVGPSSSPKTRWEEIRKANTSDSGTAWDNIRKGKRADGSPLDSDPSQKPESDE
uniref:Uncharacterized protein n=1 Tax=Mycena chlorophos TaxID=658473 RepID=A0ABQ0LF63_MYCCL|nr:predicted protein [Mycena chlorophos]